MNTKIKKIAQNVIKLEIDALKKLKKLINNNFIKAVNEITNCKSKVILCGVGKSGLIASKISATLSSVGCPSFSISANDCLHGDLGSISKNDLLILISNSGESEELHPIIKYANRNGIKLIGITSKKNSVLSKGSDIILLIPSAKEAGLGIVPTSSTSMQLAIGDALAVATINKKRFNKYDFSKLHPAGNLGKQLKTVEDLMVINEKIPFINENKNIKEGIKLITKKKLGLLIARNNKRITTGILTDGNIRKLKQDYEDLSKIKIREVMTKKPVSVTNETLAAKALEIMNKKKIQHLCVFKKNRPNKTIGVIQIYNLLDANIQ